MSAKCHVCSNTITKNRYPGIKCGGVCGNMFHVKCVGVSEELLDGILNRSANWLCEACRVTANPSLIDIVIANSDSEADVCLADIMKLLKKMEAKLSTFDDLKHKIITLETDNLALLSRVKSLEEQLALHNIKLNHMEAANDKPFQQQNALKITITGLPAKHDDFRGLIFNAISKVEHSIEADDIVSVELVHKNINRVQSSSSNNTVPVNHFFIVTLKSIELKNKILLQMNMKKTLSTRDLDVFLPQGHPEQRIYIMHHLTRFQARLYREAKNIRSKFSYKYLWCKLGHIYLRKTEGSEVHRISSMNDIFRLQCVDHPNDG